MALYLQFWKYCFFLFTQEQQVIEKAETLEDNVEKGGETPTVTKVPKKPKAHRLSKNAGVHVTSEVADKMESPENAPESAAKLETESTLNIVEQSTTEAGFMPKPEKASKTVIFSEATSSATETNEDRKPSKAVNQDKIIGVKQSYPSNKNQQQK